MKKQPKKKLEVSRETLQRLDDKALAGANVDRYWTGCLSECTECGGGLVNPN